MDRKKPTMLKIDNPLIIGAACPTCGEYLCFDKAWVNRKALTIIMDCALCDKNYKFLIELEKKVVDRYLAICDKFWWIRNRKAGIEARKKELMPGIQWSISPRGRNSSKCIGGYGGRVTNDR